MKRPQKNFLWGYGTQVHDDSYQKKGHEESCFRPGELPTLKELVSFLEIYQMKNLKVVNLRALKRNGEDYAIIASGFSMRHIYQTAKILVKQLKELKCPEIKVLPTIAGSKDDSWLLVTVKEI